MYDTLSEYRTQLVAKVQDLLPSHYGFSGHDDIRPLIVELLCDDNFTCPNLKDAGTRHMFTPLRAETIILAATFIQHALEEYVAGGTKLINKMQTSVIRSMYDHIDIIIY